MSIISLGNVQEIKNQRTFNGRNLLTLGGIHKGNSPIFHKTPIFSFGFLVCLETTNAHTIFHHRNCLAPSQSPLSGLEFKISHGSD
jgi:hypothetical protein